MVTDTYADVDTIKIKKMQDYERKQQELQETEIQTHSMVILDSPAQTPEAQRKEYETRSASIKFTEEQPEWETMDIQLRIDPTGKQDPIITRKEHVEDVKDSSGEETWINFGHFLLFRTNSKML